MNNAAYVYNEETGEIEMLSQVDSVDDLQVRHPVVNVQGVSKKKVLSWFFVFFQFWRSDFTFSHVFRNQNFEPVSSSHSNKTLLES